MNVRRARELIASGRMAPLGLRAFERRFADRTGVYAYEQGPPAKAVLDGPNCWAAFAARPAAWAFFRDQPPGYQRLMVRWIMAAPTAGTRTKRLAAVIEASSSRRRVDPVHPFGRS